MFYYKPAILWLWSGYQLSEEEIFLEILGNISEVDNKIRYTIQEQTYMNRRVMFNIISEITVLTVIHCSVIVNNISHSASEPYYIIIIITMRYVPDICN